VERLWLVSYVLVWAIALAQGATLLALLYQVGRIHLKRSAYSHALITDEGPQIHAPMPPFEGTDLQGRRVLGSDYRGRNLALLLASPRCAPCEALARQIEGTRRAMRRPPDFLLVLEASREAAGHYARRHGLKIPVIPDENASLRTGLGIDRTPYGFFIDDEGVVRMKGVVNDRGQLEGLIGRRGRYIGDLGWQPTAATVAEQSAE
jgi:methylamine dehydrogenase accessory protein MauD